MERKKDTRRWTKYGDWTDLLWVRQCQEENIIIFSSVRHMVIFSIHTHGRAAISTRFSLPVWWYTQAHMTVPKWKKTINTVQQKVMLRQEVVLVQWVCWVKANEEGEGLPKVRRMPNISCFMNYYFLKILKCHNYQMIWFLKKFTNPCHILYVQTL